MNSVFFLGFVVFAGLYFVLMAINLTNTATDRQLATEMLRGMVQHEGKGLLKMLQLAKPDEVKIFTPLKHFCNLVCLYMRLGGSFAELNEKIATIASTLASQERPVPHVIFDFSADHPHSVLVEIGNSGRLYLFDLRRLDSLDILKRGLSIK